MRIAILALAAFLVPATAQAAKKPDLTVSKAGSAGGTVSFTVKATGANAAKSTVGVFLVKAPFIPIPTSWDLLALAMLLLCPFIPDAQISFEHETGGKEISGNYLIDNSRLIQEFALQYLPYRQRVLQIINDTRREAGLSPVAGH